MKIFMLAASLRKDSLNKKLIKLAAHLVQAQGHEVDLAQFDEFHAPLYDGDLEVAQGLPAGIKHFIQRIQQADAIILASPEYNFSVPGTIKNLVDWVSRDPAKVWVKQLVLLLSASPSLVGGNRGLWNLRIPLEYCGAFVYPDMFSLATAHNAFDEKGAFVDTTLQTRLHDLLANYLKFATHFSTFKSA